jgi:hypothetical protein
MNTIVIRRGNEYDIPSRALNPDNSPFELANSTVVATGRDSLDQVLYTHTLQIDPFGAVLVSNGLALPPGKTSTDGQVLNTVTHAETATFPIGKISWYVTLTDGAGNTWDIDDGYYKVYERASLHLPGGVTLRQLIQDIAFNRDDLVQGSVTENTGVLNSVRDEITLVEDADYFRGAEIYFTSGLNEGYLGRVIGSDYGSQTLSIFPDLPFAADVGDTFDLTNFRGIGTRRNQYKRTINSLIRRLGDSSLQPMQIVLPEYINWANPSQPVPGSFSHICEVEYFQSGIWKRVKRARRPDDAGWYVDPSSLTISFSPDWAGRLDTYAIRVQGMAPPEPLDEEQDETTVDAEWLIEQASGILQIGNAGNLGNIGPGQYLNNRADAIRAKVITIPNANCMRIR